MTHSRIQLTLLSVFSIFKAKKAIFKEESTLSMGPRLSKNILEIQQIESGTLAKCWSDGRNVAKVIANLVQPFCQKQALVSKTRPSYLENYDREARSDRQTDIQTDIQTERRVLYYREDVGISMISTALPILVQSCN